MRCRRPRLRKLLTLSEWFHRTLGFKMASLTQTTIKDQVAATDVIFTRGESLFLLGNYSLSESDETSGTYHYTFDGNYGEYGVVVRLRGGDRADSGTPVSAKCTCPFPRGGCKHVVAACLDIERRLSRAGKVESKYTEDGKPSAEYLTPEEIRETALKARKERAAGEGFTLSAGETYKGTHTIKTPAGKTYTVTFYDPVQGIGHCTCPDFATNHLETCKHLLFAHKELLRNKDIETRAVEEVFPFVHIIWNANSRQ